MKYKIKYNTPIIEIFIIETEESTATGSVNPTIITPVINEVEGEGVSIWDVDNF